MQYKKSHKVRLLSCAFALLTGTAITTSAFAQDVVGTVNLTGHVGTQCTVENGGNSGSTTMVATFAADELSTNLGRLRQISEFSTNGLGVDHGGNFRVNCNHANANIRLEATPFSNIDSTGDPASGYANTISYTALADFKVAGGSQNNLELQVASGAAAATTPLGSGVYLQNATNNVVVRANNFHTASPDDILVAGNYAGTITVTVSPTT